MCCTRYNSNGVVEFYAGEVTPLSNHRWLGDDGDDVDDGDDGDDGMMGVNFMFGRFAGFSSTHIFRGGLTCRFFFVRVPFAREGETTVLVLAGHSACGFLAFSTRPIVETVQHKL
jgi:hypothetical protein